MEIFKPDLILSKDFANKFEMKRVILVATLLIPFIGIAHAGHGFDDTGLIHYLLTPLHLISLVITILACYGIIRYRKRNHA